MVQKLHNHVVIEVLKELQDFYQVGECYKALIDMTFSDKKSHFERTPNIAIETDYVKIPSGTILTFIEFFIKDRYTNAIFLYDNKMLVGAPCTVSLPYFKRSFVKVTGLTSY